MTDIDEPTALDEKTQDIQAARVVWHPGVNNMIIWYFTGHISVWMHRKRKKYKVRLTFILYVYISSARLC